MFSNVNEDYNINIRKAELLFEKFVVEHNVPMNAANRVRLWQLFIKMFPDSKIGQSFRCAQTKTAGLIRNEVEKNSHAVREMFISFLSQHWRQQWLLISSPPLRPEGRIFFYLTMPWSQLQTFSQNVYANKWQSMLWANIYYGRYKVWKRINQKFYK